LLGRLLGAGRLAIRSGKSRASSRVDIAAFRLLVVFSAGT